MKQELTDQTVEYTGFNFMHKKAMINIQLQHNNITNSRLHVICNFNLTVKATHANKDSVFEAPMHEVSKSVYNLGAALNFF